MLKLFYALTIMACSTISVAALAQTTTTQQPPSVPPGTAAAQTAPPNQSTVTGASGTAAGTPNSGVNQVPGAPTTSGTGTGSK